MKLIGDNAGRRPIAFTSPSQGVDARQNITTTQAPLILDNQGGSLLAGSTSFNDGNGIFLGWVNGIPVFSIGNGTSGISWDGATLSVIGNILLGIGNSISAGETGFGVGVGFWLGTDPVTGSPQFSLVDQFGNYIIFDGTSSNPISISSTGVINVLSSQQIDDGQWAQTSVWSGIAATPTTLNGYGITDGQPLLPNATDVGQVLRRDNSGNPYFGYQYTGETNVIALGGSDFFSADLALGTSMATFGGTINISNPGQSVTVAVEASIGYFSLTAAGDLCQHQIQISFDGGSTWNTSTQLGSTRTVTANNVMPSTTCFYMFSGTPSADIQVRVQCMKTGTAGTDKAQAASSGLKVSVFQNSTYSIPGTLAPSVPATAAMNCTSTQPVTSCTASTTLTVKNTFGTPPFLYTWNLVSGPGSITSGGSTKTVTVSDTETTTTGGATHNTTVNCTVQSSASYTPTAGSAASNVATLTIGTHEIPVGAVINVSGCTPAAYNVTNATVTAVTSTTIKYALGSTPGAMTVFGTVGTIRVTTGNCVITGTFTLKYPPITASITTVAGSCNTTTCGANCTATATATANASGGNGSYTYSWSVTSGGATITSGGSTKTVHLSDTQSSAYPPNKDPSGVKCTVNDSVGTGAVNPTATVAFQFSCPAN